MSWAWHKRLVTVWRCVCNSWYWPVFLVPLWFWKYPYTFSIESKLETWAGEKTSLVVERRFCGRLVSCRKQRLHIVQISLIWKMYEVLRSNRESRYLVLNFALILMSAEFQFQCFNFFSMVCSKMRVFWAIRCNCNQRWSLPNKTNFGKNNILAVEARM